MAKADLSAVRLEAGGDEGGVMTRKSSRGWTRNGSLYVFDRIQQSASDKESMSFGLPKVSLTAR